MRVEDIRQNWGLFLGLGIALVLLGILAIMFSLIATLATVIVFGFVLMVGGLAQCGEAVYSRRFSGTLVYLLSGTLYFVAGLIMVLNPLVGALGLTLVVGLLFLIGGVLRISLALQTRYAQDWAWRLFSGILSLLLGLVILLREEKSLDIIGLLVGLDILFSGWTIVMMAMSARNIT
jgi:uncharacterized membrane protein HdeD (DUF308 family)